MQSTVLDGAGHAPPFQVPSRTTSFETWLVGESSKRDSREIAAPLLSGVSGFTSYV